MLEGDIPSPVNPPKGCKFHTRCSKCMSACRFKEPKYMEVKPNHFVACHLYDEEIMNNTEALDEEWRNICREEEEKKALENEKRKFPFTRKKKN